MAEGRRDRAGGIFGLCELLDKHAEAIEADLLDRGWRLADVGVRYSWRDLLVMVRAFQRDPETATSQSINGPHWKVRDQLLAIIADALNWGNWQRAGKRSAPKPKPIPRPWEKPKGKQLGSKPIPMSKFHDWWDSKKRGRGARKARKERKNRG